MKHDLALPPPGTDEPQGKPSKTVKLGDKPVLPPPPKPLDEAAVHKAIAKPATGPAIIEPKPFVADVPPPDFSVEREPLPPPAPEPISREESSVSQLAATLKRKPKKRPVAAAMDDEVAIVAFDPRRPRSE